MNEQEPKKQEESFFVKTGKQITVQVAQASAMMILPVALKYLSLKLGAYSAPIGNIQKRPIATNTNTSQQQPKEQFTPLDIPQGNF